MPAHQHYFEVLGLDGPPADRKAVKRAYSKMLKLTRPEDDPDGFMRLRDAHDQALDILKWQAQDTDSEAQNISIEATYSSETDLEFISPPQPELTYADMLPEPEPEPEPESDTTYAIGATPNFDAPVTIVEASAAPTEPLLDDLNIILSDSNRYNDREQWNQLFRKARQLDIDDYVDFEQLLMNTVLRFHGYFDEHPHHETPEKMQQKLSPSITASLFKTMSWDQVSKMGYIRGLQIEWLARRMKLRKRGVDPVPIVETKSDGVGKVWMYLIGFFILAKIIQALANT